MNILSIQSAVARGHVGNSAAVFALQRLRHEVLPIDTVHLSNHPGHGGCRGRAVAAAEIRDLVAGLDERAWLRSVDVVISGYLGDAGQGPAVLDAVRRVRAANPDAIYVLDPVIGDHGRVFVGPGIPEFIRDRLRPEADLLTPNAFELAWLTGTDCGDLHAAVRAARALLAPGGPRAVIVTGLAAGAAHDSLANLAVDATSAWRVTTPKLDHPAHGAGDLFTAVFAAHHAGGRDLPAALAAASGSVHGVIARSLGADPRELSLVAAQDELVRPTHRFVPLMLA